MSTKTFCNVALLLFIGCTGVKTEVKPAVPVLGETEAKTGQTLHFKGAPYDAKQLYVCGTVDGEVVCIPRPFFEQQLLDQQLPGDKSI